MSTEGVRFPTADDPSLSQLGTPNGPGIGSPPVSSSDKPADTGRRLLGRLVDGAHHTIDRLAERAAPRVEQLEQTVQGAGDALHHGADRARDVGDEWIESLRMSVREHPVAAVGIAVAAGMLIARMSQR